MGAERKRSLSLPGGVMRRNTPNTDTPYKTEAIFVCVEVGVRVEWGTFGRRSL